MNPSPFQAALGTLVVVFKQYAEGKETLNKQQFSKLFDEQLQLPSVRIHDKYFQNYFTNVVFCQL